MKHQCKIHHNRTIQIDQNENLFRALRNSSIQIAYACDGDGICGKCWVFISPSKNISTESKTEENIKKVNNIPSTARISCLTRILGPVEVTTPYW
jgi:ferredoxin